MKKRTIKGEKYYVLLCHCGAKGYWDAIICGVAASKEEAEELNKEVKNCEARHTIRKCKVSVTF